MLRATFRHLVKGVTAAVEADLWKRGILTWEAYERTLPTQRSLFNEAAANDSPLSYARAALKAGDAKFFAERLHAWEHFRIALAFPKKTLFLDLETTGLSRYYDIITLIGWSYAGRYGALIRGGDPSRLRAVLDDAKIVVTFNGSLFDLPFLRSAFPDVRIPPVHIDLRFFAKRAGISGGQKLIEKALGFKRPRDLQEVGGEAAPLLWHKYRRGDLDALRLLVRYNQADIEGMKYLFDWTVAHQLRRRKFPAIIRASIPRFSGGRKVLVSRRAPRIAVRLTRYSGPIGPAITLQSLQSKASSANLRVVGIDLTGSEARPSGWCLLSGDLAETRRLGSDDAMVEATIQARPNVISIDSPLSLPAGRVSPFDDDPCREQFGIVRYCERVLKQRGMNIYPVLIPSMQRLTARGIRLAARFRALGFPVIESYPGAAQDIMGIPRKRASLEMLRDGLAEFGVREEFQRQTLTHDELDAITAAVVGVFFWAGKFESLGTGEEEALIIPHLEADTRPWTSKRVIGLSGPIAAGKTTAGRYLETLGFSYARYSMALESMLREQSSCASRKSLQEFGQEIHQTRGQRWLNRKLLGLFSKDQNLVVDGLRFPDDHAFLTETFGPAFLHVYITAAPGVRASRYSARDGLSSDLTEAEAHPVERQVSSLASVAHAVITNEGELSDCYSSLDSFLQDCLPGV